MKYTECPECGAHLDLGERCDCQREMRAGELQAIYHKHKGDTLGMIVESFRLGYQRAIENAAQGATNTPDGTNAANGHDSQLYATTAGGTMQGRG